MMDCRRSGGCPCDSFGSVGTDGTISFESCEGCTAIGFGENVTYFVEVTVVIDELPGDIGICTGIGAFTNANVLVQDTEAGFAGIILDDGFVTLTRLNRLVMVCESIGVGMGRSTILDDAEKGEGEVSG